MRKKFIFLSTALIVLFSTQVFSIENFSKVVAFGDSVSDNGFQDGAGFQPYTNGYVWVEYLAHSLPGGPVPVKSHAWGGAMTNQANWEKIGWSGLLWQIDQYEKEIGQEDISKVLYTIYIGGNDFWGKKKDVAVSAQNIVTAMEKLKKLGARHIVLANQYTAVISPGYLKGDYASYRTPLTEFKKSLNNNLKNLVVDNKDSFIKNNPEVTVYYINSDDLFNKISDDEMGYVFTNKTEKWLGTKEFPSPEKYLWWDEWHLMTRAHQLFADFVIEKIKSSNQAH
ncbi:SGNH/GDSL hydrolase family protein [Neptunomonas antarctica]|uniref:Phospholipase/lecithinase/hemolysin n=1 Tax=Neptunomonas antarctica TaxID=619304 RepID=A0A1N7LPC5_9GAMM|nr:SGNH/GDSL hydrolase family protein [Neptunomonas antarctica]SIS75696.1 Phospholipase/lecithinase/hemolysin [Neptunomonas antarctica]